MQIRYGASRTCDGPRSSEIAFRQVSFKNILLKKNSVDLFIACFSKVNKLVFTQFVFTELH